MASLEVLRISTQAEMEEALAVRRAVFIEEQDVPENIEIDEHDADPATNVTALHVLGRLNGQAVATGRLLLDQHSGEFAHIGRVAVLKPHRGQGFGRAIMEELHAIAQERGLPGITLGAQLHAIGFYETLGYEARDEVFLDAGIEHRWMDLSFG